MLVCWCQCHDKKNGRLKISALCALALSFSLFLISFGSWTMIWIESLKWFLLSNLVWEQNIVWLVHSSVGFDDSIGNAWYVSLHTFHRLLVHTFRLDYIIGWCFESRPMNLGNLFLSFKILQVFDWSWSILKKINQWWVVIIFRNLFASFTKWFVCFHWLICDQFEDKQKKIYQQYSHQYSETHRR